MQKNGPPGPHPGREHHRQRHHLLCLSAGAGTAAGARTAKRSFEDKVSEITDNAEKGGREYAELYEKSIEAKLTEVSEKARAGAAEYAHIMMTTGAKPSRSDLSVDVDDYTFSLIEGTVNAMLTGGEEEAPSQQELIDHYLDQVKKPERSELSIDVDDFTFSIIECAVRT